MNETSPPTPSPSWIVYFVGRIHENVRFIHACSDEVYVERTELFPPSFKPGQLYCLSWSSSGLAIFSDLRDETKEWYLSRHSSSHGEYELTVLRGLLLHSRINDFHLHNSFVVDVSHGILIVTIPSLPLIDDLRFLTESGTLIDVTVDEIVRKDKDWLLICIPHGEIPSDLVKNSRLELISGFNHRPSLVTQILELFYTGRNTIVDRTLLDKLYGKESSCIHRKMAESVISVRSKEGQIIVLSPGQSESVRRYTQEVLECSAFVVEGSSLTGKTLTVAAMASSFKAGIQVIISPFSSSLLETDRTLHSIDIGNKRIINMAERESGLSFSPSGQHDIILGTVQQVLHWMMKRQLEGRVKGVIIEDSDGVSEAEMNALILLFAGRGTKIVTVGENGRVTPMGNEVVHRLGGCNALQLMKVKKNLPVIKLTQEYEGSGWEEEPVMDLIDESRESVEWGEHSNNHFFLSVSSSKSIQSGDSLINDEEIAALEWTIERLKREGYDQDNVIVISFFEAQRALAMTRLPIGYEVVMIDHAEDHHGKILIVLTTSETPSPSAELCCQECLLALSAHSESLFVIGSNHLLTSNHWRRLMEDGHFQPIEYTHK